jgi:FHA domain-containing protein
MSEITLSVLSIDSLSPATITSVRFGKDGGTIGRDEGNTMALPDKLRRVSRLHGTITFSDGLAMLSNSSTSLPIVVGDQQLDYGEAIRITDGMHIEFGPYVLVATLPSKANPVAVAAREAIVNNPFGVASIAMAAPTPGVAVSASVEARPVVAPVVPTAAPAARVQPLPVAPTVIVAPVVAAVPPSPPAAPAPIVQVSGVLDPLQGLLAAPSSDPLGVAAPVASQLSPAFEADPFAALRATPISTPSVNVASAQENGGMPYGAISGSSQQSLNDPLASLGISSTPAPAPPPLDASLYAPLPSTPAPLIPDDFNPFEVPSAARRNSDDPLADMLKAPLTPAEAALRGDGIAPPVESLFPQQSISSADPFAPFSDAPPAKSLDGTIASLTRVEGVDDPMALFGERPLVAQPKPMRDDVLEIGSAFQAPQARTPDSPAAPQPSPIPYDPFLAAAPARAYAQTQFAPVMPPSPAPPQRPIFAEPPAKPAAVAHAPPAQPMQRPAMPSMPQPAAAAPMPSAAAIDALTRAFLEGAELQPHALAQGLTPETMRVIGSLLRSATSGAIDMLAARAATKREVQANVTIIAVSANNPLKFLPNAESALQQLLGKKMPGFMRADIAMRDAFDDLRAHEVGVIAGTRSALTEVLSKFDPSTLEQKLTKGSVLEALMPSARKAKLWELYLERYQQIRLEAEDDFQSVFGRAFVEAYERETQRVKGIGGDQ